MNGSQHPSHRSRAVESAAAAWLVLHDRGLTPAQQDEFLQWLAASPEHRESFERHRRMWTRMNSLAEWRPEHSAEPNPDLLARPRGPSRRRWLAPLAMAAAVAVAVFFWFEMSPATYGTLVYEATNYRQETLPDGSVVDLNGGAHMVVQFAPVERRVVLVQGEAQFAVAKDAARPFVVRAGGVDVRAIGTAFNLKLAGNQLEVLVTEGTVHLARQPTPSPARSAGHPTPVPAVLAALSAGQRTHVLLDAERVAPVVQGVSAGEIERLLGWKPRLLDFDSTPLAEVVAAFNRRNRDQLVIGDEELRTLPVVGSIRSDNVAGFVRMLEATMGVRGEHGANGEIVLRRSK